MLILGDSLTAGFGLQESDAYPALLQAYFDAEEIAVSIRNGGLSGDTLAGGQERLGWLMRQKPDWVAVALGANDGLRGFPVEKSEAVMRQIIEQIREAGAKPLLFGMDLPTNYGAEYRAEFTAMYRRVAEEMLVPLLPFLLQDVAMVKDLNQADGIHPNVEGQKILARNVFVFLKPIITGESDGLNEGADTEDAGPEAEANGPTMPPAETENIHE